MRTKYQADSRTHCSIGTWLVLAAALACLGPTGCHSYRALPQAAPTKAKGAAPAQRDIEAIADEYLAEVTSPAHSMQTLVV